MLSELHIENVAVVKNVTLSLCDGFSALTGETGAGKSIIIDSINLLLGARSVKELIRTGEEQALISACFTELSERTLEALSSLGVFPDADGVLYVQRVLRTDGRSFAKINGMSVPLSTLKSVGALLVNIHGQHDSQALLAPEEHIGFLDWYAGDSELLSEYAEKYKSLAELKKHVSERSRSAQRSEERIEELKYQISEIDAAKLGKNEEEELNERKNRVRNAEKIMRYTKIISSSLSANEASDGASELIDKAIGAIMSLDGIFPDGEGCISRLEAAKYELLDVAERASELIGGEDFSPEEELEKIEERLDTVNRILRKYGPSAEDVFRYRDKAVKELSELNDIDGTLSELKKEMNALAKETFASAERLTEARMAAAAELSERITAELQYLDLKKAEFEVSVKPLKNEKGQTKFSPLGCDEVEFLITANSGEPLKPLAKVASGGELSRVMLALKSVLSDCDGVGTLIFDEIDTGVSGKTSQKLGIKLKDIGSHAQVICITHSAQVAAAADSHYRIVKNEENGRTQTSVTLLSDEGRISELSRIMGGIEITENVRNTAKEMLETNKTTR